MGAEGKVGFPSIRLNEATILDLMNRSKVQFVRELTGGLDEGGGSPSVSRR